MTPAERRQRLLQAACEAMVEASPDELSALDVLNTGLVIVAGAIDHVMERDPEPALVESIQRGLMRLIPISVPKQ